jgi:hypothetical protein
MGVEGDGSGYATFAIPQPVSPLNECCEIIVQCHIFEVEEEVSELQSRGMPRLRQAC